MAVTTTTEVELKYTVPDTVLDGAALPLLAGDGIGAIEPEPVAHLEAVYVDTADRALLTARIALRRRTGGHDAGWHVKLPAAAGRIELQAPIDPAAPEQLPPPFERALRSRVRGTELTPIARIVTERRGFQVEGVAGTATGGGRVEVVDDAVQASDIRAGILRVWREWEAERLGDSPADDALLHAVDAALRAAGAAPSPSPAKLAQALGGGLPAIDADPGTAGGVLGERLALLAEDLHRGVLGLALHGDANGTGVHSMRKTLRRMRSLLALHPVAGPTGEALRGPLGALAQTLGEARDPLIAAGLADGLLADLPPGTPGLAEARRVLVDEPRAAVPAATDRAVEALLGEEALGAYALLDRLLADGPDGPRATASPRHLVALANRLDRRTGRRAERRDLDLDGLHDVRKAAKRSRMVSEELVGAGLLKRRSGLARSAKRAVQVQEALGEHRDLALLAESLPGASARIAAAGGNAFAVGLIAGHAARRLRRLERSARKRMGKLA